MVSRSYRVPLPALAVASLVLMTVALTLVFYVAPNDANQGFSQRIFYFHVSIAFTAYACFAAGAWKALLHLWKRDPRADLESYVAVHQGVIFGTLVLLTGSIWAKISWGHWWLWGEDELVLFLVLFLFYCAYFMLRFSVDPGPQRANLSAVYALFGVVLIPVSFLAIRIAKSFVHPEVFTLAWAELRRLDPRHLLRRSGGAASARTHAVSRRACRQATRRPSSRAEVRMTTAEKYVTAAYCVVFAGVLVYVVIIALKLQRLEREVDELERREPKPAEDERETICSWLSCSSGPRCCCTARRRSATSATRGSPGLAGRAATWGVRLGWLVQTALLGVQAARDDGFPWGTWAASLNLFVWFVVGAYLIWGCRRPYRLLGLVVMPLAAVLLVVARAGGGTGVGGRSHYSNLFLVLHVGLVLAAFAGFTLAAALSGLYLWQERRLKRRETTILRRPAPSLAVLDRLAGRTVLVSVPALTLGIGVGIARLVSRGDRIDALVVATLVTWVVWTGYLAARAAGWSGRRAAYIALAGFALVIVVRLALPATHFG